MAWRPAPGARLAVVAAVLAPVAALLAPVAEAVGLPWWAAPLAVSAALAVAVALDLARAPSPGTLGVRREVPPVLTLGASAEIVWHLTNPAARSVRARIADALPPSLRAERRRATVVLPASGTASARTKFSPERRGSFQLDELTLRVEGPLGLVARQGDRRVSDLVRVYPPLRSRGAAELRLRRAQLQSGLRLAQGRGGGTEFDSLREYGLDDEFRHIDWAATARTGKAIVRTYRAERNQTLLLLVDSGRTMAGQLAVAGGRARSGLEGSGWTLPRLDHAMDAAMALTVVATRLGDAAGLVAFADAVRAVVPPRGRPDQLQRVTEVLHGLDPVLAESDYRGAFATTLTRFSRRSMLVVLTELAEEPMAATLLPALPLVARDHLVVVAGIRDPEVEQWARASPIDADGAYRKAAAIDALTERRRSAARLRGLGATVVDAVPDELAGRLSDVYLEAKSTGRL